VYRFILQINVERTVVVLFGAYICARFDACSGVVHSLGMHKCIVCLELSESYGEYIQEKQETK